MENKTKTCTLLTGAGAVKDSWVPILKAIKSSHWLDEIDVPCANYLLARLVYGVRLYYRQDSEKVKSAFEMCMNEIRKIKKNISDEIDLSHKSGEISCNSEFDEIIMKFAFDYADDLIAMTTNWDCEVDDRLNQILYKMKLGEIKPTHIHGSFRNPQSLYLPTEVINEPYRDIAEIQVLNEEHNNAVVGFKKTNRLLIYGLALSALDCELGHFLSLALREESLEEVLIFDPNHKEVSKRILLSLPQNNKIRVIGYNPRELNPIVYKNRG